MELQHAVERVDRRAVLGLAAGGVLGAALGSRSEGPRRAALWLADRGGARLVALDAALRYVGSTPVPWPVSVSSRSPGEVWVSSVPGGNPRDPRRDVLSMMAGEVVSVLETEGVEQVEAHSGSGVRFLEGSQGNRRLVAAEVTGRCFDLALGDARRLALSAEGAWLVAVGASQLVSGRDEQRRCVGRFGEVRDLARGARGFWVLGPAAIALVDAELVVQAEHRLREPPGFLVASPAGDAVWHVSPDRRLARCYDCDGERAWIGRWPLGGVCAGATLSDGRLALAAPGAVLVWDETGRSRPGQGGFVELAAISLASW